MEAPRFEDVSATGLSINEMIAWTSDGCTFSDTGRGGE